MQHQISKANGNGHGDTTELVLATIRCLAADIVQQYGGGHAGTPIGAAAIGIALWRDVMRFNPNDPTWFGRDRFVLSAGHACLFQYIMLHLTGYSGWAMDELKRYHSRDFATSRAAGHPEIEQEAGIEVTTGPLGQGIANAVGLAIAQKQVETRYNRQGFEDLFTSTIWCFTGDGCLQEGVGQEAISMAGHLGLDNLVLIYDQNKVTVDGRIEACFTEDIPLRFKAANWDVVELPDLADKPAEMQVATISEALLKAKAGGGRPCIVIIDTVIGFGSRKANTGPAHGQALGVEEVAYVKEKFGMSPTEHFKVGEEVYEHFSVCQKRGASQQKEWTTQLAQWASKYPEEHAELQRRLSGQLPEGWQDMLPSKEDLPQKPQPTRKSSGIVVEALAPKFPDFIGGSADLLESTFVSWKGMKEFQKAGSNLGDHSGRQIRYGIREFSMAAIANGMAAFFPQHKDGGGGGGILPFYSTFFMFTSYALPAIRMAALQNLRTISVATHDSISIGEDGPTHQPIALACFFRALPGMRLWRPADAEETMAAWMYAIGEGRGPSVLCFSRQPVPMLENSNRQKAMKGGYVVREAVGAKPDLILLATGAEVWRAVELADQLEKVEYGQRAVRVVSIPCMELFMGQSKEYRSSIIPSQSVITIAIEAWASFGWASLAHASLSMSTFGHSGPQADLFEHFGFGKDNMVKVIRSYLEQWKGSMLPGVGDFQDLLEGYVSQVAHY